MMAGHTPGPWRACKEGKCECGQVWSIPGDFPVFTERNRDKRSYIGEAHTKMADAPDLVYAWIDETEAEANARLIAAAPELLEALDDIVAFCDDPDGSEKPETLAEGLCRLLPAGRAAITKAKGA